MPSFEYHPDGTGELDTVHYLSDRDRTMASGETPRQRSARAAQKIAAVGEMTAGLAHDFRSILAIIESGIHVAERNQDDPEKVKAALAAAHDGVRRGVQLISQLLMFARPGKPNTHPEDVNDLLSRLTALLKYGAGPGIRVSLDLAPNLSRCQIDAAQFNAAILNLVINARDAMPDGGEIRIETDECAQLVEDSDAPPGQCVRLRISDDGCGMSPEIAEHLFDPYFTTKGDAGTGLGVPQVAAFMRSSGGTVGVCTESGVGTTFDLRFPTSDYRDPVENNLWRQLDRWVNEGGTYGPSTRSPDSLSGVKRPKDQF